jgi:hypothetical protein
MMTANPSKKSCLRGFIATHSTSKLISPGPALSRRAHHPEAANTLRSSRIVGLAGL